MILFENDWYNYNAIIDTQTSNRTFVRMALVLKRMGVRNNAFMLALHRPELQGVDPFDENLTPEQKNMVVWESKENFWYYLREVCRIPKPGSPKPSEFLANRANISMCWCFLANMDYALIMPRQNGKSITADAINNWLIHIGGVNLKVQLLTKDNNLRKANVKRLKQLRDLLPAYLNFTDKTDADNNEIVTCNALDNAYLTAVAQKDKVAADNVGRGFTAPVIQSDETPYCVNIHISLPVALSSTDAARDIAEKEGTPYGNFFTTTAGRRDTDEGKFAYDLIHGGIYWNESLYDSADKYDLREIVDKASSLVVNEHGEPSGSIIVNGTFNHLQLGRTNEWLKQAIRNSRGSKDSIRRDYLNHWTTGSLESPFSEEVAEAIRNGHKEPEWVETTKERYQLRWYVNKRDIVKRLQTSHCMLCLDSSNAVGKDANGLVLIDLANMEVLMASDVTEAFLNRYAVWIGKLLVQYENLTFIPENKSSAQGILDTVASMLIEAGQNPFERIFNRIVNDPDNNRPAINDLRSRAIITEDVYMRYKGKFGFMTTGATRDFLYNTVINRAANSCAHVINDNRLSDQLLGLIEKNGRIDHKASGNDDLVIAWLMGHWFANHGSNMANYGIPRGYALQAVHENASIVSAEEQELREFKNTLREGIKHVKNELMEEDNPFKIEMYKNELRRLLRTLGEDDDVIGSFDEIVQQAAENRKSRGATNKSAVVGNNTSSSKRNPWLRFAA